MKTDYPELEGKIIDYNDGNEYDLISARIIGCSYHAGVTVVDTKTKEKVICLNRQHFLEKCGKSKTTYRKEFYATVRRLQSGYFDVNEYIKNVRGINSNMVDSCTVTAPCAFE